MYQHPHRKLRFLANGPKVVASDRLKYSERQNICFRVAPLQVYSMPKLKTNEMTLIQPIYN